MDVEKINLRPVNKAIKAIKAGNVVIFPTDTVYGFLADAGNKEAVNKIYKIKKRPRSKPLPVFVKDFKMAKNLAEIDRQQEKFIKRRWPGKYTFILKRKNGLKLCDGGKSAIALRIPKHKFLNTLLKRINRPLVQTSVNISNNPPLTDISKITKEFEGQDILIIGAGNLPKRKPSSIIDLTKKEIKILR